MAKQLVLDPPRPYVKRQKNGDNAGYASEVAHLKGIGNYGSDAWRLFCKESFYSSHGFTVRDEWKRVKTQDKALQTYITRRQRQEMSDRAANELTARLKKLRVFEKPSIATKGVWIGRGEHKMFVPQKFIEKARGFSAVSYEGEMKLKCSQ